jgi:hypothetical protein
MSAKFIFLRGAKRVEERGNGEKRKEVKEQRV